MRITKELLLKTARDTVTTRLLTEKDMVAAYLVGSTLDDDPMIGGTADIDLILVHSAEPKITREIVKVYDEVHLDIVHQPQSYYLQPRELRADPWLGSSVQNHPVLLYDVRHWFEFTQASVGSAFYRPDHVIGRARCLAEQAREIWSELKETKKSHADRIRLYLQALSDAGNAIAVLTGSPLAKRRFSLDILGRFQAINEPDSYTGFLALTGGEGVNTTELENLLPSWEAAFVNAGKQEVVPPDLHPLRKDYYRKAFESFLEKNQPYAVVMPLLRTWNKAICSFLSTTPEYDSWLQSMSLFRLRKEDFAGRMEGLDAFLDHLDEILEKWAVEHGA
jgi:hypothetical protein